jgi:glycosyltransferase involved in cell wall biosynthesis
MYGRHFFNKGTDRLLKIWRQNFSSKNCLLIIAGGIPANYYELHEEISKGLPDNIYLIDHYLNDNLLNYCLYLADAVILPYRHASMTGVVFTAAAFQKPLLATDVGSIREYLSPNTDSFLCENSDGELMKCIDDLIETPSDILKEMGKQFSNNIEKRFSWETITEDTFYDTYLDN